MPEYIIRDHTPSDAAALKALWKTCFEDDDASIDSFFELFSSPGACLTAEAEGQIVSAMHILPVQSLYVDRRCILSAGYTYALATLPAYRGRGIGTAVCKACCERVLETADAACVLPAEPALYPFYEKASGAKPLTFARNARFTRAELMEYPAANAARIPGYQYPGFRESILGGLPHAVLPEAYYDYLEACGMEFFILENGAAAVETSGGVCRIRELLDTGRDPMASIAGIRRWCAAEEYTVASPAYFRGPGEIVPHVLGTLRDGLKANLPDDLWWGLGLE